MTSIFVLARIRRLIPVVALAVVALPVGYAPADTTIGQTATPLLGAYIVPGAEVVMPAAAVSAEGTTITSLQSQSGTCEVPGAGFVQGVYNLQVLRPEGNSNYLVLGDTGDQIDPCDSQLHSYPAGIPVKVGDTLGVYVVSSWVGDLSLFGGPIEYYSFPPEPAVGATVTVPNPEESVLDESATLVPLPTSNDQCKNGGWQNFGTTFKNQGDCVSFVATGGKNPPSGS